MAITFDDERRINSKKGLQFWRNPRNKFAVMRIHYSADPDKDSPEWIAEQKSKTTADGWQREYEINFETFAGKPVYKEFKTDLHIATVAPSKLYPIIRSWDWGHGHPACVWWQILPEDRIIIFDELMGEDEDISVFGPKCIDRLQWNFWKNTRTQMMTEDYGDPAGNQNNDKSPYTTIQLMYKLFGIRVRSKASGIMGGVDFLRYLLNQRMENGQPIIRIHPRCQILIDGFKGKYSMGVQETIGGQKELPVKDGYYDHLQDALRMGIVNKFDIRTFGDKQEERERKLPQRIIRSKLLGY